MEKILIAPRTMQNTHIVLEASAVVIEDHEQIGAQFRCMIQRLKTLSASERPIANNCHELLALTTQPTGMGHLASAEIEEWPVPKAS